MKSRYLAPSFALFLFAGSAIADSYECIWPIKIDPATWNPELLLRWDSPSIQLDPVTGEVLRWVNDGTLSTTGEPFDPFADYMTSLAAPAPVWAGDAVSFTGAQWFPWGPYWSNMMGDGFTIVAAFEANSIDDWRTHGIGFWTDIYGAFELQITSTAARPAGVGVFIWDAYSSDGSPASIWFYQDVDVLLGVPHVIAVIHTGTVLWLKIDNNPWTSTPAGLPYFQDRTILGDGHWGEFDGKIYNAVIKAEARTQEEAEGVMAFYAGPLGQ